MAQRETRVTPTGPRRLNTPSIAEAVASQLRARILDGDLVDGSELPTESVLLTEFPVSRPSLREAFRILETEGLLKVRRGKRGGTVITHPTADTAAYHVGLLLHAHSTTLKDVAEARNLLEPLCAERAARRRDHVTVGRRLATLAVSAGTEDVEEGLHFTRSAVRFHQALVDASGNATLSTLAGVLESIWDVQELTWARSAVLGGEYPDPRARRAVVEAHQRVAAAIETGDPVEAARQARGHLEAASPYVASREGRVRILDDYGGRRQLGSL